MIPRTHFHKHQPIPLSLIQKANEKKHFSQLRTWVVLKQLYKRHTIIYNLNYEKLSQITGISHQTLRSHIAVMFENKWVKWTKNGHLILNSINRIKNRVGETCILVPVEKTKAKQILQFRKVLIHNNIKNQEWQLKNSCLTN
jgi:hypothetical protein